MRRTVHQRRHVLVVSLMTLCLASCGKDEKKQIGPIKPQARAVVVDGIVRLDGKRSNYLIVKDGGGYVVTDVANNGKPTAVPDNVLIRFEDQSVDLGMGDKAASISAADLKLLTELYLAFFNRLPDAEGLAYWIDQRKTGQSIDQIADHFYDAALQYPVLTGFAGTMSNADFVKLIYKNVLRRAGNLAPADADVRYWSDDLASGTASKGTLIRSMLIAAHSFGNDPHWNWVPQLLDNKVAVANFHAVEQGISYRTPEESIARTIAIAAMVTPGDTAVALKIIEAEGVIVKPTIGNCIKNRSMPGCDVVLPTLEQCIVERALAGCTVVLPSPEQCTKTPLLDGCLPLATIAITYTQLT